MISTSDKAIDSILRAWQPSSGAGSAAGYVWVVISSTHPLGWAAHDGMVNEDDDGPCIYLWRMLDLKVGHADGYPDSKSYSTGPKALGRRQEIH